VTAADGFIRWMTAGRCSASLLSLRLHPTSTPVPWCGRTARRVDRPAGAADGGRPDLGQLDGDARLGAAEGAGSAAGAVAAGPGRRGDDGGHRGTWSWPWAIWCGGGRVALPAESGRHVWPAHKLPVWSSARARPGGRPWAAAPGRPAPTSCSLSPFSRVPGRTRRGTRTRPRLSSPPPEQRVIDEDLRRLPVRDQQRDHHLRGAWSQVIGVPSGTGEEIVRPVVRPQPRQARPGQHPAHRPHPGLREETAGEHGERTERRRSEQRREHGQQRHQRRRQRQRCIQEHRRGSVPAAVSGHGRRLPRRPSCKSAANT
jgi:hypothetical protein